MSASIHIETAGCAFNASDSEAMAGVLRRAGYSLCDRAEDADLVILNTCTVKDKTFNTFRRRLDRIRRGALGVPKPVVVAGCIPKAYERASLLDGVPALGPDSIGRVEEVVREALRGAVERRFADDGASARLKLPHARRNPAVEILPIARGCLSACSFCQTRIARGRLVSFNSEEILGRARRAIDEGVRIFWITGQDVGAYGRDIGYPLPNLLGRLLDLPGDFVIRLGMTSPQWMFDLLPDYLPLFDHPKMFRFLHVPIQSGSERVLRDMRRDGGVAEFAAVHAAFTERFPDLNFVTDLIVGYPAETDEDFARTLDLVERHQLGFVNCSKFSPRPGTAAARLAPLAAAVVSARVKALMARIREIGGATLTRSAGRVEPVVVEQIESDGTRIARTAAYRPVHLSEPLALGARAEALLAEAVPFHFLGKIKPPAPPAR